MISHLLDTSALLAHYFAESGADIVQRLFESKSHEIGVSVISIPEMRGRLRVEIGDISEVGSVCSHYFDVLASHVVIDRSVAECAEHIRQSTKKRLPLIDAVIAACALDRNAVLVHKDPHMSTIPTSVVEQIVLPE